MRARKALLGGRSREDTAYTENHLEEILYLHHGLFFFDLRLPLQIPAAPEQLLRNLA